MHGRSAKPPGTTDDGFTLVELLIVSIIIGILAGIAIPLFLNQQKKGYDASMKSDLRTVANEEESYHADNPSYFTVTQTPAGEPAANQTAVVLIGTENVTLSHGNYLDTAHDQQGDNGYCLIMKSTENSTATWVYDSTRGGLQERSVTSCLGASSYS